MLKQFQADGDRGQRYKKVGNAPVVSHSSLIKHQSINQPTNKPPPPQQNEGFHRYCYVLGEQIKLKLGQKQCKATEARE